MLKRRDWNGRVARMDHGRGINKMFERKPEWRWGMGRPRL